MLDWTIQLAAAVEFIHSRCILHRDLKSSNIFLLRNNVLKLGDFGIARVLDSTMDKALTVVGTPCVQRAAAAARSVLTARPAVGPDLQVLHVP